MRDAYSIFLHLLDASEHIWAQRDGPPRGGDFPTDEWMSDDLIVDPYSVTIPPDAPPGRYSIVVGMYDPATDRRLPLAAPDGTQIGTSFTIAEFALD